MMRLMSRLAGRAKAMMVGMVGWSLDARQASRPWTGGHKGVLEERRGLRHMTRGGRWRARGYERLQRRGGKLGGLLCCVR